MKKTLQIFMVFALTGLLLPSCISDPNSPGLEFMPDMYRSPAIEAYVDYGQDPYRVGEDSVARQMATFSARMPADGSIPYGGEWMPYPYSNTVSDYERAGIEVTSPMPMHQDHIEKGKEIYERMCDHCHGPKGEGNGKLVENEKILGVPNFAAGLKDLPEGNMFHTITYGKGIMGSHAAQVNQTERWEIIQYIHVLQNGGKTPQYNDAGFPIGYEKFWKSSMKGTSMEGLDFDAEGMVGEDFVLPEGVEYTMMNGMKTLDGELVGKPGYVLVEGKWYTYEEAEKLGFWKRAKGWLKGKVDDIKEKRAEKQAEKAEEGH